MISHRAFFGDAEREFALPFAMIEELERQTATGIGALSRRIVGHAFTLSDLHSTIRLALIGGGTDPEEAAALIKAYVHPRPLEEAWALAVEIMNATLYGVAETTDGAA